MKKKIFILKRSKATLFDSEPKKVKYLNIIRMIKKGIKINLSLINSK